MVKCWVCDRELDLPFTCKYCSGFFCVEHRLPEKHNCEKLGELRKPLILRPQAKTTPLSVLRTRKLLPKKIRLSTSRYEVKHLFIAWLILGFCFSVRYLFNYPKLFPLMFAVSLIAVGSGFVFHELAHKFTALKFGCWAEFRMWGWGLTMALIFALISGGSIVFAAPGAVYVASRNLLGWEVGRRENGVIAFTGPLANLVLVFFFYLLQGFPGIVGLIGKFGFYVNLWLAAFNLIPFMGLDGSKVFLWNPIFWALVTIPTWLYTVFQFLI